MHMVMNFYTFKVFFGYLFVLYIAFLRSHGKGAYL